MGRSMGPAQASSAAGDRIPALQTGQGRGKSRPATFVTIEPKQAGKSAAPQADGFEMGRSGPVAVHQISIAARSTQCTSRVRCEEPERGDLDWN